MVNLRKPSLCSLLSTSDYINLYIQNSTHSLIKKVKQSKFWSTTGTPKDWLITTPRKRQCSSIANLLNVFGFTQRNFIGTCIFTKHPLICPQKCHCNFPEYNWNEKLVNVFFFSCRNPVMVLDYSVSVDHTVSTIYTSEKTQWEVLSTTSEVMWVMLKSLRLHFIEVP